MDATSPKLAIVIGVLIVVIFALALLRRPIIRAVLFTSEIIVLLLIVLLTVLGAGTARAYTQTCLPSGPGSLPRPAVLPGCRRRGPETAADRRTLEPLR